VIPLPITSLEPYGSIDVLDDASEVTGVTIDSRRVQPGDLFVAIRGGVRFVDDARARGAAATLVPDDDFAAMAALGRAVRERSQAEVVGITGSTGKTSTKDILAALCRPHRRTIAAEASYNAELGVPLTLCRLEPDTELLIAELAMRGFGQIAALCEIARPTVGVITAIGPVHLEFVESVEGVARAKAELLQSLPRGAKAVVPAAAAELEPHLRGDLDVIRVGEDARIRSFRDGRLEAEVGSERIQLELPFTAQHQVENTLTAAAAYWAIGLPLDRIGEGAAQIEFSRLRGEELPLSGGGVLINDCWNANPTSMRAALRDLAGRNGGRRIAVLGGMAELGPDGPRYHREVGELATDLDVVVGVGQLARDYAPTHWVADAEAAAKLLGELLEPGDVVLVKGSRAVGLERVAANLLS
jgi:UDP-N-acetylmuramoyl-tripeptide--D-alanyl-D-alanine ligase